MEYIPLITRRSSILIFTYLFDVRCDFPVAAQSQSLKRLQARLLEFIISLVIVQGYKVHNEGHHGIKMAANTLASLTAIGGGGA